MQTRMLIEAAQAPQVCARQIEANRQLMREAGAQLRGLNPPFAATLARGSSDQAAAFAKALFETRCAMPTLSHSPSIGALYGATSPRFRGVPLIAISQSGRSPDLLRAAGAARDRGALLVVLVNDTESPLAAMADILIPLHAGPETSVAATKSFIASLAAIAHLTAEWSGDAAMLSALDRLSDALSAAWTCDWDAALPPLVAANSLLVLGRGLTLPIAGEAALKLKETCSMHAEAVSSAEVAHGPMTLVGAGDPVLVFGATDAARAGLRDRLTDFVGRGATVIACGDDQDIAPAQIRLPLVASSDPVLHAIAAIQRFYALANALALARGRNPDHPPHLAKVTRTL